MRRAARRCLARLCNQGVKFTDLIAFARDLGADCLATGHYVRRVEREGRVELWKGRDPARDQSYFLYGTTQDQLDYLRFPLGDLPKSETRKLAAEAGLVVADKPDSQDICFVPDGDYAGLVKRLRPETAAPGEIVDLDGAGAWRAPGRGPFHHRPAPRDRDRRPARAALRRPHRARGAAAGGRPAPGAGGRRGARSRASTGWPRTRPKSRPRSAAWRGRWRARWDGERLTFASPEYGVAPGQSAVFYDGERLLGGGTIVATEAAAMDEAVAA